jgi:hypothetical protein
MPIHVVHTALVDEQHLFRFAVSTFFVGSLRPPRSVSPPQYTSYSTIDNDVVSGYSWSMRRFGGWYSLTQLHARAMRLAASWRLFRITRATALSNLWEDREIPHCIRESIFMRSPGIEGIRAICIRVVVHVSGTWLSAFLYIPSTLVQRSIDQLAIRMPISRRRTK